MKLPQNNNHVEVCGNFSESDFIIGDTTLILEYLRSGIYSSPLQVICREYMANAWDANIENNNGHIPIRIKLPNIFDNNLEISDNGPGISPDRIDKVVRQFGKSTKRENNLQIGAWGLGIKSAWSMTDAFMIRTTAWEGDFKVYREYSCVVGDDRQCKLISFDSESHTTDEETGVTIAIPIESRDFTTIANNVKDVCRYWEVKPIIDGKPYEIETPEFLYNEEGFSILKNSDRKGNSVLIGNMLYPLDINALGFRNILTEKFSGKILLKFDIGQISLAISRENIQYDDPTKKCIINRLNEALEIIQRESIEAVQNASSLWDAHSKHGEFSTILGRKEVLWRGHKITGPSIPLPKGTVGRRYEAHSDKSHAITEYSNVYANVNSMMLFRDVRSATVKRTSTLFDQGKINTIVTIDNPTEHLIEICDGFPKLSTIPYARQKYSVKIYRIYKNSKYNKYRSVYETLIGKESIMVDDISIDDFSCWIPYDRLYEVNRELLWDVLKKEQVCAVPQKAQKYFDGELPTFEEYVKEQAQKIPDRIIKLRAIDKHLSRDYRIDSDIKGNIFELYEKTIKAVENSASDLAKYPGKQYSKFINDERDKPAIEFVNTLESTIKKEFPIIECLGKYTSYYVKSQVVDFINYLTKKNPTSHLELTKKFEELQLS